MQTKESEIHETDAVEVAAPVVESPEPETETSESSIGVSTEAQATPSETDDQQEDVPAPRCEIANEWTGFAVSVQGLGHVRKEIPCQDASCFIDGIVPAVIACDGCGSATLSHEGAQAAVRLFASQVSILGTQIAQVLDCPESTQEDWQRIADILIRTLAQAKLDLVASSGLEESNYDFTVACAIRGKAYVGCLQIGDGAIVVRDNGICYAVFQPEKGEFGNETRFLSSDNVADANNCKLLPAQGIDGVAAVTDGVEHRMFQLDSMRPGPAFDLFFNEIATGGFERSDLIEYLTRAVWTTDPRDMDDRTVAVMVPDQVAEFKEF